MTRRALTSHASQMRSLNCAAFVSCFSSLLPGHLRARKSGTSQKYTGAPLPALPG